MKRFLSMVLILLMLIPPMVISAEGSYSWKLEGGIGEVGEVVNVVFSAENLPDCASYEFYIDYDKTYLRPTSHAKGSSVKGFYVGNLDYSTIAADNLGEPGYKLIKLVGATTSATPAITGSLTINTLGFEIIAPLPAGGTTIEMVKYKLSRNDVDLTKITDLPLISTKIVSATPVAPEITKIEVTTLPSTLEYLEGKDPLDVTGGKITVYYNNDTSEEVEITPAMVSGFDNTTIGTQALTVTYEGYTDTFDITIRGRALQSIAIEKTPCVEYIEKQEINLADGRLLLIYDNDTTETLPLTAEGVAVTGYQMDQIGSQELTVAYGGKETTFFIHVAERQLQSIAI